MRNGTCCLKISLSAVYVPTKYPPQSMKHNNQSFSAFFRNLGSSSSYLQSLKTRHHNPHHTKKHENKLTTTFLQQNHNVEGDDPLFPILVAHLALIDQKNSPTPKEIMWQNRL